MDTTVFSISSAANGDTWKQARCRILVVEDCPETRYVYQRYLARAADRFDVVEAETIEQALQVIRRQHFDCVLLDYQLPDGEGIELLEELAQSPGQRQTAVVMITGQGDETIAVDAMKLGAKDYLAKDCVTPDSLLAAIDYALEQVRAEYDAQRYRAELERQSVTDPLTGLHNRRYFEEQLTAETHRAARYRMPLSVLMIDLDHFKAVNDTHGHTVGDKVLQSFARMLGAMARASDHVVRYGGEEFCVILTNTDLEGAQLFAERICVEARQQEYDNDAGEAFGVRCSVGVAESQDEDAITLVHRADQALYQAKRSGRDKVCVAEASSAMVENAG